MHVYSCVDIYVYMYPIEVIHVFQCAGSSAMFVDIGCLLRAGLPPKSAQGTDQQSDRQAAQMVNPRFLKGTWDDAGAHCLALLDALVHSAWFRFHIGDLHDNGKHVVHI